MIYHKQFWALVDQSNYRQAGKSDVEAKTEAENNEPSWEDGDIVLPDFSQLTIDKVEAGQAAKAKRSSREMSGSGGREMPVAISSLGSRDAGNARDDGSQSQASRTFLPQYELEHSYRGSWRH